MRPGADRGEAHLPPAEGSMTRRIRRNSLPDLPPLSRLEAELHASQAGTSLTAGPAEILLAYVREHPGVQLRAFMREGRGPLSFKTAENLVRDMLADGRLISDEPGAKLYHHLPLWVADDGEPDSENRL
jgi:hypothetical protein